MNDEWRKQHQELLDKVHEAIQQSYYLIDEAKQLCFGARLHIEASASRRAVRQGESPSAKKCNIPSTEEVNPDLSP